MTHSIHRSVVAASLLLGCSGSVNDDALCDGEIDLAVTTTVPETTSSDLLVGGTASVSRNVTIRSIAVGGIQAKADSFNFGEWSVTVPFATLLAAKTTEGSPDEVTLPVVASPACGPVGSTSVLVDLDRHPEIHIDMLEIAPSFPASQTFLPANESASAILRLTANAEARGATVMLEATGPARFEGLGSAGALVLAGDGASAASASVLVTATGRGTVFVTAKSGAEFATPVSFVAAGAPRIVPDEATLAPGQTIVVSVIRDTDEQIHTCTFDEQSALSVGISEDGQTFEVTADEALDEPQRATIVCRDAFGQSASGTYVAEPPVQAP